MEKEEILKKYRREGVDEGREEANRRGDDAGFYAMCVLALLLMLYQAFTGQVFGDVAAVLTDSYVQVVSTVDGSEIARLETKGDARRIELADVNSLYILGLSQLYYEKF